MGATAATKLSLMTLRTTQQGYPSPQKWLKHLLFMLQEPGRMMLLYQLPTVTSWQLPRWLYLEKPTIFRSVVLMPDYMLELPGSFLKILIPGLHFRRVWVIWSGVKFNHKYFLHALWDTHIWKLSKFLSSIMVIYVQKHKQVGRRK